MPAKVQKRGSKWRVVEPSGRLVKKNGTPVDSGGFRTKKKALAQARAINSK